MRILNNFFLTAIVTGLTFSSASLADATVFAGQWRSGSDDSVVTVRIEQGAFFALTGPRFAKEPRLTIVKTYVENGKRPWAGIWRTGIDASPFDISTDLNAVSTFVNQHS